MPGYTRETRNDGNPNKRDTDREAARGGRERAPEDIPTQDTNKRGIVVPGNAKAAEFVPTYVELRREYKMGPPQRPPITHDEGFLVEGRRAPTAADYVSLAKWIAMLEGAELLRPDLTDAVAAYRHFLRGKGSRRKFSYDRYIMNDSSGQTTLRNAILDFQFACIYAWMTNGEPKRFQITGPAIPCGSESKKMPYIATRFPYPATENWQKAIGSHYIWLSGDVDVITNAHDPRGPKFKATMTLHAEDRYNFNPGAQDIATNIKDRENGEFEKTGLGHQYDHLSEVQRLLEWVGTELGVALSAKPHTTRLRQPSNNRQVTNRL